MMRLRRASMIAALPLLAWTATASAECAWVLWVRAAVADGNGLQPVLGQNGLHLDPSMCNAVAKVCTPCES